MIIIHTTSPVYRFFWSMVAPSSLWSSFFIQALTQLPQLDFALQASHLLPLLLLTLNQFRSPSFSTFSMTTPSIHAPLAITMGPKVRQRKLSRELEHHIATNWADFRKYAPKKAVELQEVVLRFTEGPFCGMPVSSVPVWYLDFLCCGGENFLLWHDKSLSNALANMGYEKINPPRALALPPPPSFPPMATLPSTPDFSALANLARKPNDSGYLLSSKEIIKATSEGPGLHTQTERDVSLPKSSYYEAY